MQHVSSLSLSLSQMTMLYNYCVSDSCTNVQNMASSSCNFSISMLFLPHVPNLLSTSRYAECSTFQVLDKIHSAKILTLNKDVDSASEGRVSHVLLYG